MPKGFYGHFLKFNTPGFTLPTLKFKIRCCRKTKQIPAKAALIQKFLIEGKLKHSKVLLFRTFSSEDLTSSVMNSSPKTKLSFFEG